MESIALGVESVTRGSSWMTRTIHTHVVARDRWRKTSPTRAPCLSYVGSTLTLTTLVGAKVVNTPAGRTAREMYVNLLELNSKKSTIPYRRCCRITS